MASVASKWPHIAFVSTNTHVAWGGSEELWAQSALRLAQRGARVSINVPRWPKRPAKLIKLAHAGSQITRRARFPHIWDYIWARFFELPEFGWLDSLHPDLVVVSQGNQLEGAGWLQACSRRRLRYASIVQAAIPSIWPDDNEACQLARGYAGAVANFFVAHENVRLTQTQLGCKLPNVRVVRNPFLASYDAPLPWPTETGITRLACVARLDPAAKGQDILFEVLHQAKWRARKLELTLFGTGHAPKTLEALSELLGLDNVKFGGFASDVGSIWAGHHALVLPSRYEGLPLSLVEAMLCGRPSIVTNVSGNTELLQDNVTGFVAAAPMPTFFDEALERAWDRRADWPEIGSLAARHVRELVPADPASVFADELLNLIH
jgi:glycosyltransferase involved in cell wall biosynthesis